MSDQLLECRDCGSEFLFDDREQQFFEAQGFAPPKRCRICRSALKAEREAPRYKPARGAGFPR
jgi:hypothetical protein